ncbi:hypothetical protein [Thermoflavimicrobium dichotomicum]|uniref:Uncharacterized protein n=1 Tax=Thermoflavimicrobium dichotomicum TaxID=46223 RepID=A0A1I3QB91_9BACL|nr:hypothetical protein [Thermoflavimicrobium dichotomicum]SFJ30581.1 hypothetical protein SAMN05421852_10774 [Thermoflavimicrobium dichotomicum]
MHAITQGLKNVMLALFVLLIVVISTIFSVLLIFGLGLFGLILVGVSSLIVLFKKGFGRIRIGRHK